jgi:hypothetical protein
MLIMSKESIENNQFINISCPNEEDHHISNLIKGWVEEVD